jgi:hypothetical protein
VGTNPGEGDICQQDKQNPDLSKKKKNPVNASNSDILPQIFSLASKSVLSTG